MRRSGRVKKKPRLAPPDSPPPTSPIDEDEDVVRDDFSDGSGDSESSDSDFDAKLRNSRGRFRLSGTPNTTTTPHRRLRPSAASIDLLRVQKMSAPFAPTPPPAQLLTDAHAPVAAASLIMSAVTVNKLRKWLRTALSDNPAKDSRLLVLSGPPGTGKSTAVRVIASELDCELSEWHAPLPAESSSSTTQALLDSIQGFFVGLRYPSLLAAAGSSASASARRRVLVIDDLPLSLSSDTRSSFSSAAAKTTELAESLASAAKSSPHPTVIILSDSSKARYRAAQVLGMSLLESPFVHAINVKPATDNAMTRVIEFITSQEHRQLSAESLSALVQSSQGDIRAALNALQLHSLAPSELGFLPLSRKLSPSPLTPSASMPSIALRPRGQKPPKNAKRSRRAPAVLPRAAIEPVGGIGSDATLDTFHAVSKVLNNKREADGSSKYDPEQVLSDSRAEPTAFVSFLHQNYQSFFSSSNDASDALEILSDAEAMLEWRSDDMARIAIADCAASMVTRAFFLHNSEPVRTGWRPIQGPDHYKVKQAAGDCLDRARYALDPTDPACQIPARALAIDILPYMDVMGWPGARMPGPGLAAEDTKFAYHNAHPHGSRGKGKIVDAADSAMAEAEDLVASLGTGILSTRALGSALSGHWLAPPGETVMPSSITELADDAIVDDDNNDWDKNDWGCCAIDCARSA
jgi:cell cycle checkpoint protein